MTATLHHSDTKPGRRWRDVLSSFRIRGRQRNPPSLASVLLREGRSIPPNRTGGPTMSRTVKALALVAALGLGLVSGLAWAQTPGVTATEIKIGNTNPYSGPASAYGTIGKALGAYFKKV